MIVQKLKSGHVIQHFGLLRRCLDAASPDLSASQRYREMQYLVTGAYQAWAVFEEQRDGAMRLTAMLITNLRGDVVDVRAVQSYTPITTQEWRDVWAPIGEWARENGCTRVVATTDNPRVIQVCRALGWDTDTRLVVGDL